MVAGICAFVAGSLVGFAVFSSMSSAIVFVILVYLTQKFAVLVGAESRMRDAVSQGRVAAWRKRASQVVYDV